jgi:hypothetical protein
MKRLRLFVRFVRALQGINTSLALIARAQCTLACIPHPDLREEIYDEPAVLGTDRDQISNDRRIELDKAMWGEHTAVEY